MIFQTLDDKKECVAIYRDGKITKDKNFDELSITWDYSPYLKGKDIKYAKLICGNKSIKEICPEELNEEYKYIFKRLNAFKNSFEQAKISLNDNCFFDLVPNKFLVEFCEFKNKITKYVLEKYETPEEYQFYRRFNELLVDIELKELNIDIELLKTNITKDKDLLQYRRFLNVEKNISYNMFGSITGRLTTNKKSFPIHNFPRTFRQAIKPKNDWLVAFDINAAELRTSLGLLNKNQPDVDLYEDISKNIYKEEYTRKQIKEATTAWLYNSNNELASKKSDELEKYFNKKQILEKYWDGKYIYTPFNRKIESDEFHAISYLNQSTFIDLFHRLAIKIDDFLRDKNSFISFLLHDEIVLDIKEEEKKIIVDVIKILQDTQFGKFLVNVKAGKDFANMKKLNIKA